MASSSKSTRSTATLHVPFEITIDILLRLPVKSLLRFQSVCKNWYALIRSPNFISQHKTTHSTPSFSSLLVTHYDGESNVYDMSLHYNDSFDVPVYVYFPFLDGRNAVSIVGVCDGLVCLSLSPNRYASLILCNPATRQFREIPDCEWVDDSLFLESGWWVDFKQVSFGFGFDPSASDYKLTRILYTECPMRWVVRADVYVVSTDTWREIEASKLSVFDGEVGDILLMNASLSNCAGLNGVLYWAAMDYYCEGFVVSFDLGDEVFQRIRAPQRWDEVWDESYWRVMQMKDKLALLVFHPDDGCFDVWVLNENKASWTNQFKVGSFLGVESPVGRGENGEITVVGCGKNGELVVTDHKESGNIKLFLYDPQSQETKNLRFGQVPYQSSISFWLYTETLLAVKENNENRV